MGDRPPTDAPLYLKVAAGLTTGAVAIAIASPTDLVKVSAPKRALGVPAAWRHMPGRQSGAPEPCHLLCCLMVATVEQHCCDFAGQDAV